MRWEILFKMYSRAAFNHKEPLLYHSNGGFLMTLSGGMKSLEVFEVVLGNDEVLCCA